MSNSPGKWQAVNRHLSSEDAAAEGLNSQLATQNAAYDALVLDGGLRQSLMTVRSLGRRGLRVAVVDTFAAAPALSSRWCQQAFVCPARPGTQEYLMYLEQLLDCTNARVLIASSDATIALIRRHREHLEQRVRIALAREPALGIAIDKEQTLEMAEQLGIGVPRGVKVKAVGEVEAALREIGLPAVVKPAESWVWGEQERQGARLMCKLVTTLEETRRAVEELTSFGGSTILQQFLSGRRESLSFFYAHGEIYARFAFWGKRTQPPLGGSYVLRQSMAFPPDTGEQAERLVREIGLEGHCQVEFRRDSAGKPYLMEINPRLNLGIEGAVRAGVDFPYLLYQWANGDRIDHIEGYREGCWIRFLAGDIVTTIQAVQQRGRPGVSPPSRAILDFCASFFMPTRYDYLDWEDPLPAFIATTNFTRRWLGGAIMKKLSRLKRRFL